MAATERRVSSSRRGMTVLGKVPVVPKPINLPSQRLENRGLFSDVDIVPRGTCSWGSTRLFPGASGSKSRKSDAASLTPSKSGGDCENGGKVESKSISSVSTKNSGVKDGGGMLGNSIQFSSAKATTGQALDKNGKIEEQRTSNSYTCNSLDCQKQETTAPPLPRSGDGYVQGVSGPPGFVHSGPQGNQSRAGVPGPDLQSNGVGAGVYPNVTQQDGLPSFTGAPHLYGKKEREIIVIHMVGSPAFYGNYPPQLGYPDLFNKNASYENFPLQFGNFEPYFGFQGHGRLDGGASVLGSDMYNGHEDFVCYEKECYQGRKKNSLVHGNFQESTFLGGAQREVHEALTSHSSLRPRCPSQKHLSRNAGRLRSLYHNGRLVPIEDVSAVPVPEKRITLLTKLSQPKLLSLDETGVGEFAHAEYVVGSALQAHGDEGKPPETFEVDLAAEDGQGEKTVTSAGLKVTNEDRLFKEPEMDCKEVSVFTTTCNDTFLHCKVEAAPLEAPALKVCQACKKTSVLFESASEEVSSESTCRSNSTDGCAVEVKHVIFDADSSSLSAVKGLEDASLSSSAEAADDHKQLDNTILKKSSARISSEGKFKQRLLGKKGVTDGNWKPKRPVGAAKVNIKVFAPKAQKAAGRKNTSKTLVNECVSEASSSTICNEHSMGDISADSIKLSSETENKLLELLLPSILASSGDVPVDAFQDSAEEKPKDAAFVDCVASEGRMKKRKGKNTRKTTLPKDRHDNTATVHDVESLVKTVFEDISNTEVQKLEPKDADSTKEKAWRPKGPTASQCKSATKASGMQVSKADVVPNKLELQGRKLDLVCGSTFSADSSEVAKEEQNVAQKSNSLLTSQRCDSETLQLNKSPSFEARSTNNARGGQNLVFRKRSAEQAALGHQSSRDASGNKEPNGSHAASSKGESGPEHPKQSFDSTSLCENSLVDMNCSVSASKYHMVRRRVYHVVEGSGGDYSLPSATFPGKSHLAGKYRSLQTTSLQNQAEFRKKTVNLSSGSSYAESEHSEEFSDLKCMVEVMSCRFQGKGMCHSGLTANQLPSSSGIEESKAKKHVRPGERVPAWKPKATPVSGVLQNIIQKKDDNKCGVSIFTYMEGESKKIKDSDSSSQVSASSHLDGGENCEEQTIKNVCGLPLEMESVCNEPLEIHHAVNIEDSLPSIESEEVMNSQQKSEIVVSKEEVEHTSALKHAEGVLKAESLGSGSSCELVLQQSMQTRSEESAAGNRRPPFKKKNAMSYEKADRYHQMMFKKYKESGHWKPKAGLNSRASNRASRNVSEAPMQDVLVLT